jgi:cobalt-zinc-cadmium efflux system protein
LHNPAPIVAGTVIWVALAGIVVNSLTAYLFHHDAHHDINIHGAFLHMPAMLWYPQEWSLLV